MFQRRLAWPKAPWAGSSCKVKGIHSQPQLSRASSPSSPLPAAPLGPPVRADLTRLAMGAAARWAQYGRGWRPRGLCSPPPRCSPRRRPLSRRPACSRRPAAARVQHRPDVWRARLLEDGPLSTEGFATRTSGTPPTSGSLLYPSRTCFWSLAPCSSSTESVS